MILRAALAWMVMFGLGQAATCEDVIYADTAYSICTVDMNTETLHLYLYADPGVPIRHPHPLTNTLHQSGATIGLPINPALHHATRSTVRHKAGISN